MHCKVGSLGIFLPLQALSEALVEVRAELIEVSQKTVNQRARSRVGREELEEAVQQKTAQLQV